MDDSPTTLFDSYEQDFQHITQSIRDKLEGSGKDQRGEQRKAALRKVEIELDEADDIVSQLEVEIQGIPQSIKSYYTPRLKQAKADLNKYKKLSKEVHSQLSHSDLLGGFKATSDDPYGERNDRVRLLTGTEVLSDGSRSLADTTRIALEAEEQGADILRNLRGQREHIESARDTLRTTDTNISRASRTVQKMIRQMYKQRVILSGIIIFCVILILTILYFKLFLSR